MNAPQDSALARVADLLEEAAREIRNLAGSSRGDLDPLDVDEAECLSSGREPVPETTMPTASHLLTREETIAVLRVGERSFSRLRSDRAQKFPGPVRGRPLRWRRGDIEKWLARRSR